MSGDPEDFVRRWSRLKRKTARAGSASPVEPDGTDTRTAETVVPAAGQPRSAASDAAAAPEVDIASLPPIESITGDTDIRAFLRSGVPAELTKAALRKVWTSDPAIRDFIEMAENQWDFTDPNAIPGFGPLDTTEGVYDLVSQTLGNNQEAGGGENVARQGGEGNRASFERQETATPEPPKAVDQTESASHSQTTQDEVRIAASQHADMPPGVSNRRTHGRAVPR